MFGIFFNHSRLLSVKYVFCIHIDSIGEDKLKGSVGMKILKQLAIIFGICLVCDVFARVLPVSLPGNVIAMIVIFLLLAFNFLKERSIQDTGDFLLKNMAFFFIPSGTAIIEKFGFLEGKIITLIIISIISTLITFLATYYTVCAVMKLQQKGGNNK